MKYTLETLQVVVSESFSVSEVLKRLGFTRTVGSTHSYLAKRIRDLGIDTSHFRHSHNTGKPAPTRLAAKDILIFRESGNRNRTAQLRRALLEIGREEKCETCPTRIEWNGKKLVLQIDHKDGDYLNDRPKNLRFLCPNCHSQTPNFSRAKHNKPRVATYCGKCSTKLGRRNKSGHCPKCRPGARQLEVVIKTRNSLPQIDLIRVRIEGIVAKANDFRDTLEGLVGSHRI